MLYLNRGKIVCSPQFGYCLKLHTLMTGTGNNIKLLLFCQVDELNCIAGYTDCEVCILFFLRMLHCINKLFFAKYINIQMMCTLIKVSVHYIYKVIDSFLLVVSKCARIDGLCRRGRGS